MQLKGWGLGRIPFCFSDMNDGVEGENSQSDLAEQEANLFFTAEGFPEEKDSQ